MSRRRQRRVLNHLDQRCKRGVQRPESNVQSLFADSDFGLWTLDFGLRMVGEDRIELSPRVPRTRMLALHHTPIELVRQVRLELTIPCLRGRCLDPIWLLTHGGTERTRTVIDLIDNQVPHLSATVPNIADFDLCFGLRSSVFGSNRLASIGNRKSKIGNDLG